MSSRRRTIPALVAALSALVLAIALASCGGDDSSSGAEETGPASFAPADTPLYLEATVRPEGDQKANAEALISELGSVPLLGSQLAPEDLADQAVQAFDEAVGADVDYAEDVQPWLGNKAGLAVTDVPAGSATTTDQPPAYVLAVETTDDAVARDSLARIVEGEGNTEKEYDGVSYYESANGIYDTGVFDGMLVFANGGNFERAVDAAHGDSLADSDDYQHALAPLSEEGLGSAYVDFDRFADLAAAEDPAGAEDIEKARGLAPELFDAPLAAKLVAGEGSLALDVSMPLPGEDTLAFDATDLLADSPPDSYAAFGFAGVGEMARALITRLEKTGDAIGDPTLRSGAIEDQLQQRFGFGTDDLADAFGDGIAYAVGDLGTSAGAQVDVTDDSEEGVPAQLLDGLEETFGEDPDAEIGPPLGPDATAGFTKQNEGSFGDFELGDGKLTIATADDPSQIIEPGEARLGDEEGFAAAVDALGSDYPAVAYADLGPILEQIVGSFSIPDAVFGSTPPELAIAQFAAGKLDAAAIGTRRDGDRLVARGALTLGG